MKLNKYIGLMIAAGFLTATSCSDFDDYNETFVDANASADKTLWENITSNPELSDFVTLVKKAGFDKELNGNRYYTVWAPLNSVLVNSEYFDADSAVVLERFVKNHISDYNYGAVGNIDERIHTLNRKSIEFKGGGSAYSYSDVPLKTLNLPGINGVLHTLDGVAKYYPNVYDFVFQSGRAIDSLKAYFQHYEDSLLDVSNSILGPIVDGKQTYTDSVMLKYNGLTGRLKASLSNEDSSYTFIMPVDTAWKMAYNRIKPYYKYANTTKAQDLGNASGSSIPDLEFKSTAAEMEHLSDSLVKFAMVSNLIYSNTNGYNKWLEDGNASDTDTLYTTLRNKLSNPKDILARTVETVKLSNGMVRIVDSIAAYPWETYAPEIKVNPYRSRGRVLTGTAHSATLKNVNLEETGFGKFDTDEIPFIWVEPNSGMAKPELDIYLPNVLSTTYNFYCVFFPASVANAAEVGKPNNVNIVLNYCKADGKLADWKFSADGKGNPSKPVAFENDITKADTVFLGQFTFPVAYNGLDDDYCPNIKITSPFSQFNQAMMKKYTRDICIAAIILKPVELDEFEKANKEANKE